MRNLPEVLIMTETALGQFFLFPGGKSTIHLCSLLYWLAQSLKYLLANLRITDSINWKGPSNSLHNAQHGNDLLFSDPLTSFLYSSTLLSTNKRDIRKVWICY